MSNNDGFTLNTGDKDLDNTVSEWLRLDKNKETRCDVLDLLRKQDTERLREIMFGRLVFGTAGIRGEMGSGFTRLNDLVIIQTAQGMTKYLLDAMPSVREQGITLGWDGRYNSKRFAQLTARAFISENIPVKLFSKMVPTPFVAYSVLKLKCGAGIMITASHNPKMDNGFKVYWSNGAQIISPHDKGIQSNILKNLDPWDEAWDADTVSAHDLVTDPFNTVFEAYMKDLEKVIHFKDLNKSSKLTFTYTSMHGVGYKSICKAVQVFGFSKPFVPVIEQIEPDPEFPTVKFPNPEEGKSALDLAMKTAEANGSTIILANDPDADRLAVAEKQESGDWKVFSGNELGSLLGWYCWFCYKTRNPNTDGSHVHMIASTVSSKMLRAIGNKEGFNFEETLTGFKWMGNKAMELMDKGETVLFAFEEAIGFMVGTSVLDKDGVTAACTVAEMCTYLNSEGLTLQQKLEDLYHTYGHHITSNSYFLCYHPPTVETIFQRLRNWDGKEKTYPNKCGGFDIKYVRDLTTGYDNSKPNNKATLPLSQTSQMITFSFTNGVVATIRTSGTEPKIKYYTEMCADTSQRKDVVVEQEGEFGNQQIIRGGSREILERELADLVSHLISEFLEPEKNNLTPRS